MMAPLANSPGLRVAGLALAAVVFFNLIMALALVGPIGRERARLVVLPLPAQAAAIVELLEATPPSGREAVLKALNSPALRVSLQDRSPVPATAPPRRGVKAFLRGYDEVFRNHAFQLEQQRRWSLRRLIRGDRLEDFVPARLTVRLHDGRYAVIEPARGAQLDSVLTRGLLIGGIAGIAVLAGLFLAVRQTARPVAALAASARQFADRLDAADLAETGPRELRELAASFNAMKARIRALMSERTRVLAAIAHDLRTYLTRLRLRAELIDDADQRARAERDLDEMAMLIDDTLLFAKETAQPSRAPRRIDLGAELRAFLAARRELGQPVSMADAAPESAAVLADPLALRRIIANLTDNALRYGELARLRIQPASAGWILAVEDEGPGIPAADLSRLVEPFERLEPSRGRAGGGAGLGLAIVRALTESQGGRLVLRNRDGGGLSAEVHLRAAP